MLTIDNIHTELLPPGIEHPVANAENVRQTVVICGACGAEERVVDNSHKTECPFCDEYIY